MLITIGRFKRCYLYARYIGGKSVKRIMKEGEQIWPGEHDRIRRLVFEEPEATTEDYAYWKHVCAGLDDGLDVRMGETKRDIVGYEDEQIVGRKVYLVHFQDKGYVIISRSRLLFKIGKPIYVDVYYPAEKCRWARVELDGRVWYVKRDLVVNYEMPYALATLDGRGVLDFGNDGPYRGAVKVGDMVGFEVDMPERDDNYTYAGDPVHYDLPLLKGTKFKCGYDKGGKKNPGGMTLHVDGYPSGEMFVHGFGNLAGHWRGYWTCWTPPGGMGNYGQGVRYKDEHCPGDTGYTVQVWNHMNGGSCARPRYPAFKRTIKLKVVDIVYND